MTVIEDLNRRPGWHVWRGVPRSDGKLPGWVYARRPRSSPPVVLRDKSGAGAGRQMTAWEAQARARGVLLW
jgi:hypothetical protein